jgi:hypothetical protein
MLAIVIFFLLLYDLYNSIPFLFQPSEGVINISVCVVWTIYMIVSYMTNTLILCFTVTKNGNHMKNGCACFLVIATKSFYNLK